MSDSVSIFLEKTLPDFRDEAAPSLRQHCPACGGMNLNRLFSRQEWAAFAKATVDSRRTFSLAMDSNPDLAFDFFLQCDDCGTVFTDLVPPEDALSNFYQTYYGNAGYLDKIKRKLAFEKRRIFFLKFLVQGRRFLDIGCNIGCAVEAARWAGFSATGLELDQTAVTTARDRFPKNTFLSGTVDNLDSSERFDLVYCCEVIEHVPNPQAFLSQVGSIVSSGGVLMLTTPDSGHRKIRNDLLQWDSIKPPEHITLFTRAGIRSALESQFSKVWILPNSKPGLQVIAFKRK